MADIAAANIKFFKDVQLGTHRGKIYQIISDGSGVTAPITPGYGYGTPIGNYTDYVESPVGTFTLAVPAGTNLSKRYILFISR